MTVDHVMRNQNFSNHPIEAEKSEYDSYKIDGQMAPELYLGTRGGNGVEDVTKAWNDYIGNVLMMDPYWPPEVNTFSWNGWKRGSFMKPDGKNLTMEIKHSLVNCMTRHGFTANVSRYHGYIMTTSLDGWISANNNRDGFEDRVNLGIIDGLFDLIADETCQPSWD